MFVRYNRKGLDKNTKKFHPIRPRPDSTRFQRRTRFDRTSPIRPKIRFDRKCFLDSISKKSDSTRNVRCDQNFRLDRKVSDRTKNPIRLDVLEFDKKAVLFYYATSDQTDADSFPARFKNRGDLTNFQKNSNFRIFILTGAQEDQSVLVPQFDFFAI